MSKYHVFYMLHGKREDGGRWELATARDVAKAFWSAGLLCWLEV